MSSCYGVRQAAQSRIVGDERYRTSLLMAAVQSFPKVECWLIRSDRHEGSQLTCVAFEIET